MCKARTAFAASSPTRALSANVFGSGRIPLESIQIQNLQNELAACKTLGLPILYSLIKAQRFPEAQRYPLIDLRSSPIFRPAHNA